MRTYRKQLEKTFFRKISRELEGFKRRVMKMEKEEIYRAAYKIDSVTCIYEALVELSDRITEATLEALTAFPSLLAYLYDGWLKYEDSQMEDISRCLDEKVAIIQKGYQKRRKRKGGRAA